MTTLSARGFAAVSIKGQGFPFTVEDSLNFVVIRADTDSKIVYIRNTLDVLNLKFQI